MTFRELIEAASKLPPEKLDQEARVLLMSGDCDYWGNVTEINQDPPNEDGHRVIGCIWGWPDFVDEQNDAIIIAKCP